MSCYDFLSLVVAFALAAVFTPIVGEVARRWGMVARPRVDRWHQKPTALLGGVALFAAVSVVFWCFLPQTSQTQVVYWASAGLWLVGLVDDLVQLKPYQKLIGQMMGAAIVVGAGLTLSWTPWPHLNLPLTLLWLVGITNALNLLDNMDGLAAGIAAIAAAVLAAHFLNHAHVIEAVLLGVLASAALGFLLYNFNPASIFMGDCGSHFLGFFLASAALLNPSGGRSRSFLAALAVPVLVLFIPIFDTVLVTLLRKLSGRPASQGGRDHTSHRLVALGLSERWAVLLLYSLATLAGLLALLVSDLILDVSLALIAAFIVTLTLLGVYLAGVKVYDEAEVLAAQEKPLVAFLIDLSYKRRVFEVFLDVVLIVLACYASHALLFGPIEEGENWERFLPTVSVTVIAQGVALLWMGVYRGLWRYVSVADVRTHAGAVVLGTSTAALTVWLVYQPVRFSWSVFVLSGVLLLLSLTASRLAFRVLRELFPTHQQGQGRRVLIYGAGDGGELLVRELFNNRTLRCVPVGFADDDPLKKGKVIHGLRVFGGNGAFQTICAGERIEEVLISSSKFSEERIRQILNECRKANVTLRRMRIHLEEIDG